MKWVFQKTNLPAFCELRRIFVQKPRFHVGLKIKDQLENMVERKFQFPIQGVIFHFIGLGSIILKV